MIREPVKHVPGYGDRLRARLKRQKKSQSDLAKAIGKSRQTVSNALKDRVSAKTMRLIDDVLRRRNVEPPSRRATSMATETPRLQGRARSELFATATEIEEWAGRREAQEDLPRLVRNIIRLTTPDAKRLSFRTGDGVQLHGTDGQVESELGSFVVPRGLSIWELGAGADPAKKANKDYKSRTESPEGIDVGTTTFVFVTPRRWDKKDSWASEKRAEHRWRDVRAYDADDIEGWLEATPSIHVWFSARIGIVPSGCLDLESWWSDWRRATKPELGSGFILSGREKVSKAIASAFEESTPSFSVKAESQDESIAVFAAYLESRPEPERDELFARSVVVKDESAWRFLVGAKTPLILLPTFDVTGSSSAAAEGRHAVIVPLGSSDADHGSTIAVGPIAREPAVEFLNPTDKGPRDEAWANASLARRSMKALRRKLSTTAGLHTPAWAKPDVARSMIAPLFIGAWHDQYEGDRKALQDLAGASHDELVARLLPFTNSTDSLLRNRGHLRYLVSPEDAWGQLGKYVLDEDLQRFASIATEVLGALDPSLELEPEKRWMAAMLQPRHRHSGKLRSGIASTIGLIGARTSANADALKNERIPGYVAQLVKDLLAIAKSDPRIWASVSDHLPDLAEGAPDTFLAALESSLQQADALVPVLFTDAEPSGLFGPSSPHVDFLWALERLAWSETYLPRVIRILDRLDQVDPRGNLTNRPLATLRAIFLPWLPQTAVSVEKRIAVLNAWASDNTRAVWQTLLSMLPEFHGIGHYNQRPKWHDWLPDSPRDVTNAEYFKSVGFAASKLFELVGVDADRWKELVEAFPRLPEPDHDAGVLRLEELDVSALSVETKSAIWEALRELVVQHQNFADAQWAMPAEKVTKLARVRDRFVPSDVVARNTWLFSHRPRLPDPKVPIDEIHEYDKDINARQSAAIREVLDDGGLDTVFRLAAAADNPFGVGLALGRLGVYSDEVNLLRANLVHPDAPRDNAARGYVAQRTSALGAPMDEAWIWKLLGDQHAGWSPAQRAVLLISLIPSTSLWDKIQSDKEAEQEYWRRINAYAIRAPDDIERAVRSLITHRRPLSALELLSLYVEKAKVSPILMLDALEASVFEEHDEKPSQMFTYNVERLLDAVSSVDEVEEVRVARLELSLLPAITRHERTPRVLQRVFLRHPSIFVDAIKKIYRKRHDPPAEEASISEEERSQATRAYELIRSIRKLPGTGPDETVDGTALRTWVEGALSALKEADREEVAISEIGQLVGSCPAYDPDGAWPCMAVRELIEELKSDAFEQSIAIGRFNSRGVTTRSITTGGALERGEAARYSGYATTVNDKWHRTAAMLRRIALQYEADARREDEDVAIQEDLG